MAVEAALGGLPGPQLPEQHFTAAQLQKFYPDDWDACHRFAVVRHPVRRALSFIRFIRRFDPIWRRHLAHVPDEPLLWDLLMSTNLLTTHTPARMIEGDVEILHLETLDRDWPPFADRFSLPDELPQRNTAPTPTGEPHPALALAIAALFEDDFTRFGYELPTTPLSDLAEADQGRVPWARLRARALKAPSWELAAFEASLDAFRDALPVASWRDTWDADRAAHPLSVRDSRDVIVWTERVHDHVNRAPGKPEWLPWSP